MKSKYKQQLRIDRYNLLEELGRQAQLYMDWALQHVDAEMEEEESKQLLELRKAELYSKIKKKPHKFDIDENERVTESMIQSIIQQDKEVQKLTSKYNNAVKNQRVLREAKRAFEHRKKMLEAMAMLNTQLHFADPKEPVDLKQERLRRESKKQKELLRSSLRRKRNEHL